MNDIRSGGNGKPGGRLWLVKWLLMAALVALLLVLIFNGAAQARG